AGATVHGGGVLAVRGLIRGPLIVAEGAAVQIEGTFSAQVNGDGLVMIAGVITTRLPRQRGVVLVAPGTLFTTGPWPVLLDVDGTFIRVADASPWRSVFDEREHLRLTPRGLFVSDAA